MRDLFPLSDEFVLLGIVVGLKGEGFELLGIG